MLLEHQQDATRVLGKTDLGRIRVATRGEVESLRAQIESVATSFSLSALQGLVDKASDQILKVWPTFISDEEMIELRHELAVAWRSRRESLSAALNSNHQGGYCRSNRPLINPNLPHASNRSEGQRYGE